MALASIPNDSETDFTEAVYAAQGAELNILGVNWVFAPVGDVNSERENPVIGVRSFGDGTYSFHSLCHMYEPFVRPRARRTARLLIV